MRVPHHVGHISPKKETSIYVESTCLKLRDKHLPFKCFSALFSFKKNQFHSELCSLEVSRPCFNNNNNNKNNHLCVLCVLRHSE